MARIDHVLTDKQRLFGRVFHDVNNLVNTAGLPGIRNFIDYTTWNVALNHSHVISSRLVNSLQYTYSRSTFGVGALPVAGNVSQQSLGIKVNRGQGGVIGPEGRVSDWRRKTLRSHDRYRTGFPGLGLARRIFLPRRSAATSMPLAPWGLSSTSSPPWRRCRCWGSRWRKLWR
jgi:hypothetical protein